jgi:hypothetical protein
MNNYFSQEYYVYQRKFTPEFKLPFRIYRYTSYFVFGKTFSPNDSPVNLAYIIFIFIFKKCGGTKTEIKCYLSRHIPESASINFRIPKTKYKLANIT